MLVYVRIGAAAMIGIQFSVVVGVKAVASKYLEINCFIRPET